MELMSAGAVQRAMKLQNVMLRAMAKRITWFQAAEILGISFRQMQRWKTRFEHEGYEVCLIGGAAFPRRRWIWQPYHSALEAHDKNGVALPESWKVDIAKLARGNFLKNSSLVNNHPCVEAWKAAFEKYQ